MVSRASTTAFVMTVRYAGFGPSQPASTDSGWEVFGVPVYGFPGALNTLDDAAVKRVAALQEVKSTCVSLRSPDVAPGAGVIEGLLRRHRPNFESEVDGHVGIAWFSYLRLFRLDDF